MLLAPASPLSVGTMAATASELNIDGVNRYGPTPRSKSTSQSTQFSDVAAHPSVGLRMLLLQPGGALRLAWLAIPMETFLARRPLSRWKPLPCSNACLDRITEVTDELRRLMKEFERRTGRGSRPGRCLGGPTVGELWRPISFFHAPQAQRA